MKGTLVFDHLNDLIYLKCCAGFVLHVRKLAGAQGLVSSEHCVPFGKGKMALDPNIIIQLFSPLVTSQRFMREQFGNPYTSISTEDGTNIVFQDYMGFLFLRIGTEEVSFLKRSIGITISLVSYFCGPDVFLLKKSTTHCNNLDKMLDSWNHLQSTDQSTMVEGISQIYVNQQLNTSLVNSLRGVVGKVQGQLGNRLHALLFLETKLLSWYSTKQSINLAPEDLVFLLILCHKTKQRRSDVFGNSSRSSTNNDEEDMSSKSKAGGSSSSEFDSSAEFQSKSSARKVFMDKNSPGREDAWDFVETASVSEAEDDIIKYVILLKEGQGLVPHVVHIGIVQEGLYFVLVSEAPFAQVTTLSTSAFQQSIQFHSKERDQLTDKIVVDQLESITKKLLDSLKKLKHFSLRNELASRWDRFKTNFVQYMKTKDSISVQTMPLVDIYREIFRTFFLNENTTSPKENKGNTKPLDNVWKQIKTDTDDFWGFLRLKTKAGSGNANARTNLLMESREHLSINDLQTQFPGLVHWIYVDRNRHNVILPTVDFSKEETIKLTKSKIWGMVKFARDHMQQGHFSLMWKDSAFNYAYFLWFEDSSGSPIRAKQAALPWEGYPIPGIMCGDFYKRVITECFPNILPSKIRCVELFCIHLGLVTSSCVLEHSKRLATNIFDEFIAGNQLIDY